MGASVNKTTETAFEPLLQFDMEMEDFLSDWHHCDHVSSYLARMISHNRTDPVRHSNFFSSALNELFWRFRFAAAPPTERSACRSIAKAPRNGFN